MDGYRVFENPEIEGRKANGCKAIALNFNQVTRIVLMENGSVSVHFSGEPMQIFVGNTAAEVWMAWQELSTA